ncbi:MAG TPA: hypothetical protein PLV12_02125 [Saprospiraceae bacterium]|nr:hypothetical protein [Saprospiraceae bacterium]
MNSDNNNLKNKIREEQGLPAGFEWENMQAGIYSQMGKMNPKPTALSKWTSAIKWTGFAIVIATTAIVAFLAGSISSHKKMASQKLSTSQPTGIVENKYQTKTTNHIDPVHPTNETLKAPKSNQTTQSLNSNNQNSNETSSTSQNQVVKKEGINKANPTLQKQDIQNIFNSTTQTYNPSDHPAHLSNDAIKSGSMENNKPATETGNVLSQTSNKGEDEGKQLIVSDLSTNPEVSHQNPSFKNNGHASIEEAIDRKEHTVLASLLTRPAHFLTFNSKISCSLVPESRGLIKPLTNNDHGLDLLAGGGVSLLSAHFTTTTAQETVLSSESVVPGNLYYLILGKKIGKNLRLQTGFEYQNLWTRFDYRLEKTFNGPISNQLVEIHINALTGDSTFIYADTMISIKETRTIRHYNQLQVISIPFMAEYEKRVGQWSVLLAGGVAAHFRQSASGRTLLGNEIIGYNNDQPIHSSFLGISIRSQLGMMWHFNERVGIQTSISGAKSINNWSSAIGTNYQPWLLSFSAGLRYKF